MQARRSDVHDSAEPQHHAGPALLDGEERRGREHQEQNQDEDDPAAPQVERPEIPRTAACSSAAFRTRSVAFAAAPGRYRHAGLLLRRMAAILYQQVNGIDGRVTAARVRIKQFRVFKTRVLSARLKLRTLTESAVTLAA